MDVARWTLNAPQILLPNFHLAAGANISGRRANQHVIHARFDDKAVRPLVPKCQFVGG